MRTPEEEAYLAQKEIDTLRLIQRILIYHNGEESNIGMTSDYWKLKNHYRALRDRNKEM